MPETIAVVVVEPSLSDFWFCFYCSIINCFPHSQQVHPPLGLIARASDAAGGGGGEGGGGVVRKNQPQF